MKKKWATWLLALSLACGVGGLMACDDNDGVSVENSGAETVFTMQTAYAKAQELGYEGSLEEFIASISGKDGADGAKGEDGKDGLDGKDGVGIKNISINEKGEFVVVLSDDSTINLGKVVGEDGKDGLNGANGIHGTNGKDGKDGVGVSSVKIIEGELVFTLSDGSVINLGNVVGKDGTNGNDGEDGKDGVSISSVQINDDGTATVYYSDATSENIGKIVGEKGETGAAGVGVRAASIIDGKLMITLTNDTTVDCGKVLGEKGEDGANGEDGKDGVGISSVYFNENNQLVVKYTNGTEEIAGKIPACVHSYGDWTVDEQATCTSIGVNYRTCADCGYVEYEILSAVGHTFGEALEVFENTHAMACSACNQVVLYTHSYRIQEIKDETHHFKQCVCGKIVEEEHIFVDRKCLCGLEQPTEGLKYVLSDDGTYYSVSKGTATAERIVIPSTYNGLPVQGIGFAGFNWCRSKEIVIPDSITRIWDGAFAYCSSLTNILVDENNGEYQSIDGNLYTKDGTTLLQYAIGKTATEFTIPDSVTSIRDGAFAYCSSLTEITIPNSVTSIRMYAFAYCSSLTEITIPNSVTSIERSAFEGCSSLTEITIPNSVTSIGQGAFADCSSLTEITIPNSVTSIENGAFGRCIKLTNIFIDENNSEYQSIDGNLYTKDGTTLLQYAIGKTATEFTIPDSVTSIEYGAFEDCSSLTEITIPNSVTSIRMYAFAGCNSLAEITIPNSVTSIGVCAFNGCSNLTEITIPNSVTSIEYGAFADCSSLTEITIPNSVTLIERSAFYGCSSLTEITIPNSVTSIGDYAFRECSSLTEITIPNSVTSIGDSAFEDCSSLTEITIPESVTDIGGYAFNGCSGLTEITIPNSVTSIGVCAFDNCSSLTEITIPESVTSIRDGAFAYCSSLTNILVDENNSEYQSIDGNLYTKDGTTLLQYAIGKTATEFTIPDSVTSIRMYAFAGCNSLAEITIPNSVTSIEVCAFDNCSSLTSVYYDGTSNLWATIEIGSNNTPLTNATRYYYSETEPELNAEGTAYNGNYWHYVNGIPTPWIKEN